MARITKEGVISQIKLTKMGKHVEMDNKFCDSI